MAVTTKPKRASQQPPQAPAPTAAAVREAQADHAHLLRLVDRIEQLYLLWNRLAYDGAHPSRPPESIRDCVAAIFVEVSTYPDQGWPSYSWPLLNALSRLILDLEPMGTAAFLGASWPERILYRTLNTLVEAASIIREPPEPQAEFEVTLESIKELREDGVSITQIAKIYDWYVPGSDRTPDTARVREMARINTDFAPIVVRQPPRDNRIPAERPRVVGAVADYASAVVSFVGDDGRLANAPTAEYADVADAVAAE